MSRILALVVDRKGSSAVEFALAVPVLVSMIWGVFQVSMILEANAGMQNALGQAARYATVYRTDTSDHRPTDSDISAKITSYKFGVSKGTWGTPVIVTNTANATKTITVSYSQPMDFLFFTGPTVTLTKTKLVYMAA